MQNFIEAILFRLDILRILGIEIRVRSIFEPSQNFKIFSKFEVKKSLNFNIEINVKKKPFISQTRISDTVAFYL